MAATLTDTQQYLILRDIERQPPDVQTRFLEMVSNGVGMRMAQMLACHQAPTTKNTDQVFNRESRILMSEMNPKHREKILKLAHKAGVDTAGKYYLGGLGRYTDQCAWVSTIDDAIEVCKKKRLTATGTFNYRSAPVSEPPRKTPIAPDILDRYKREYVSNDPRLREQVRCNARKLKDLESEILAKHTRQG